MRCYYLFELIISLSHLILLHGQEMIYVKTNVLMSLDNATYNYHFENSFSVRNQIVCISECAKVNSGTTYYYALFKPEVLQCVCKIKFHWKIIEFAIGTNTFKRIHLREGKGNNCINKCSLVV